MLLREAGWTEERAQAEIAANPSLIGVSPSWRVQQERPHGGGRPDIFFASPDGAALCVVELQLGGVDRYHITKTAEFLARERKAAPLAECHCILVAESYAGRHGRLAEALARVAPLQLFTMRIDETAGGGALSVQPHHLPDLSPIPQEDDTREARWRAAPWFRVAEGLLEQIMVIDPAWSPKFNSQYIGGQRLGGDDNSIAISEDRGGFKFELKLERSDETDIILSRCGFSIDYKGDGKLAGLRRRHYLVRIAGDRSSKDLASLHELVIRAHQRWRAQARKGPLHAARSMPSGLSSKPPRTRSTCL